MTAVGNELDELLGDLPSDVRQALSHPHRRRILRILLGGGSMSSSEIASHPSAPCSAPCLTRHIRLLSESSLLVEQGVTVERGMTEHFFSAAPMSSSVHEVLAATERVDRDGHANYDLR